MTIIGRSFQRRALPRSVFDPFQDYSGLYFVIALFIHCSTSLSIFEQGTRAGYEGIYLVHRHLLL